MKADPAVVVCDAPDNRIQLSPVAGRGAAGTKRKLYITIFSLPAFRNKSGTVSPRCPRENSWCQREASIPAVTKSPTCMSTSPSATPAAAAALFGATRSTTIFSITRADDPFARRNDGRKLRPDSFIDRPFTTKAPAQWVFLRAASRHPRRAKPRKTRRRQRRGNKSAYRLLPGARNVILTCGFPIHRPIL